MSFSVGIVGLPNVGKSTLFKALTKQNVKIASHPFTTIDPNIGKVFVPDERLTKLAKIAKPEKITPTTIEFVDIAGLVKGAHKGEGLGNQFLAQIRNCDAILQVIRCFEANGVENVLGKVDPKEEIEIIKLELLMKDLETLKKIISKLEKKKDKEALKKIEILRKIEKSVSEGKLISEINLSEKEKIEIKEFQFLTQKPIIYILNPDNKPSRLISEVKQIVINLKNEEEISELSTKEREELKIESQLDSLIKACYNVLDLITFFTIAGKETRAWTIKKGARAPTAGGKVHTDFEKKFIRAEVINWEELFKVGSRLKDEARSAEAWKKAKELGLTKTVGKDYLVQDGDVIEFKI